MENMNEPIISDDVTTLHGGDIEDVKIAEPIKQPKKVPIKLVIIVAVIILLAALAYYWKGWFIAATVDGSPISRLAVIHDLEHTSGKKALDTMIVQKLIASEAKKKNVTVTQADIDKEIKSIEDQVAQQGGTLDQALAEQGISRDDLTKQIVTQKELEGLLADKIQVNDTEVAQYIKDNKVTIPKGQEADYDSRIREQIRLQKLNQEAPTYVASLKAAAKINYYVNY